MLPVIGVVACTAVAIYCAYESWGMFNLKVGVGSNDDAFATETFLGLLDEAEEELLIHDDGNSAPGSPYEDQGVVDRVAQRLDDNAELRIECLFNFPDETLFVQRFRGHERVSIKVANGPRSDVHFKIIDGGRKGYVSRHPLGSSERSYRLYDCTSVPRRWAASARDAALGRYIRKLKHAVA